MPFVVTGKCIKCRYTDCVEVCPVDCFYEGKNMVVINPEECIDCGVCEPECPIEAIKSDDELTPAEMLWAEKNEELAQVWPNITKSKGPMPDAEENADRTGEEKTPELDEAPGGGDGSLE